MSCLKLRNLLFQVNSFSKHCHSGCFGDKSLELSSSLKVPLRFRQDSLKIPVLDVHLALGPGSQKDPFSPLLVLVHLTLRLCKILV